MNAQNALDALRFAAEAAGPGYAVHVDRLKETPYYRIRWVRGDTGILCTLREDDVAAMGLYELTHYVGQSFQRLTRIES